MAGLARFCFKCVAVGFLSLTALALIAVMVTEALNQLQ